MIRGGHLCGKVLRSRSLWEQRLRLPAVRDMRVAHVTSVRVMFRRCAVSRGHDPTKHRSQGRRHRRRLRRSSRGQPFADAHRCRYHVGRSSPAVRRSGPAAPARGRTGGATVDYGTLLGVGVRLVVDSATRIDTAARKVELASGRALDYDYAVGSVAAIPSVPGAPEYASPLAEESAPNPSVAGSR